MTSTRQTLSLITLLFLFNGSFGNAAEITFKNDDGLAGLALEAAQSVCPEETIAAFMDSTSTEGYSITMRSKVLASGLGVVTLRFDSVTKYLVVQKPYDGIKPSESWKPVCTVSSKGLSKPNL